MFAYSITPRPISLRFRRAACLCIMAGTVSGLLRASGADADWPRFLGPHGDNTSDQVGLADQWPPEGPPLIWEKRVGTGYSAPSVLGRVLVLHHRQGDEEIVEAMDAITGESRWRRTDPSGFMDPYGYNNGPRCTPTLTSNRCYTFGAEGRLLCLDLQDGSVIWERDSAKDWDVPAAFFGVGSTPLLLKDRLIVMTGGQPNSGVVALQPETGETIWESVGRDTWNGMIPIGWRNTKPYQWKGAEKLASYSSPTAAIFHGQAHLLCLMRQGLVSLDPDNGHVRFKRWFRAQANESVNAMTPVATDTRVLLSSAYYRLGSVALEVNPDGRSFEESWRSPSDPFARDPDSKQFEQPVLEVHWSTPVLHEGHLYAFGGRNEAEASLRCLDVATGALNWVRDEGWRRGSDKQPKAYGRGSAILVDEKLIALGEGGKLGLFRPSSTQPIELCSWQVPSLQYPVWTGPVISQGRIYLRSENQLVCLDLRAPPGR